MTDFDPGTPPAEALENDHLFAAWAATVAGELLLQVRVSGLEGKALKDAGDLASHELLMKIFAEHMRESGMGRRQGSEGIHRYTETQSVASQSLLRFSPQYGLSDEQYAKSMTFSLRLMKKMGRA